MSELLKQFHICENRCSHLDPEVIKTYFPNGGFEEARDNFFSVREDDINEFYKLQYPFIGSIVFDGKVFTRLVRVVPEFVISIIKTGMPTIITLGELEVYEQSEPVILSHHTLTPASEIIIECANLFNSIGLDNQNRSLAEVNRLNRKLKLLEIGKSHYDLLGVMQSIYTSVVLAANGANLLKSGLGHLYFHANYKKRDLLHSLIGPILDPLRVVNLLPADTPMDEVQFKIIEDIRKKGQLELISPTDAANIIATRSKDNPEYIFRLVGDFWEIKYSGEKQNIKTLYGMKYLHMLLQNPNKPISVLTLEGNTPPEPSNISIENQYEASSTFITSNEVAEKMKDEYRTKLLDLETDLTEARKRQNYTEIETLEEEKDKILNAFNSSIDKFGRPRKLASPLEKSRTRVSHAVTTALEAIEKHDPDLAEYLDISINPGYEFQFTIQNIDEYAWTLE